MLGILSTYIDRYGESHEESGLAVRVEFEYQPTEKTTNTDPGCEESIEICQVIRKDNGDIFEITDDEKSRFEELIWKFIAAQYHAARKSRKNRKIIKRISTRI